MKKEKKQKKILESQGQQKKKMKKKPYKWIKNRFIKRETERLITAAQDQALPTQ